MSELRVDPLRVEGTLFGAKRRAVEVERDELLGSVAELDRQLATLARQRRELVGKLRTVQRRLAPRLGHRAGRQPAPDGSVQLPPVRRDAQRLWGRRLRSVCLALLRGQGEVTLPELHALLHRHGYLIANRLHVKTLADALGYEVQSGRVRRVARGVYELIPGPTPAEGRHGNPELNPYR